MIRSSFYHTLKKPISSSACSSSCITNRSSRLFGASTWTCTSPTGSDILHSRYPHYSTRSSPNSNQATQSIRSDLADSHPSLNNSGAASILADPDPDPDPDLASNQHQSSRIEIGNQQRDKGAPWVDVDEQNPRAITVTWASGIESTYHNIWLRDHCRCPQCYHPKTKQRLLNTFQIPPDVKPLEIQSTTEGLHVLWPTTQSPYPNPTTSSQSSSTSTTSSSPSASSPSSEIHEPPTHSSLYPWRWLMNHSYAPSLSSSKSAGSATSGLEKILWGKGIGASPPSVQYEEVMNTEEGVLKWLTKIAQYGFSLVKGVPATPTDTEALIRRIAFIRETHYGGFWDFTSNLEHGDTAYTNLALAAHTDTTYFSDPCGLQMFHLLSHRPSTSSSTPPSGGESLLVDGFLAAKVLKDVHPEAYAILSKVRIKTHSAGDEETLIKPLLNGGYPILEHDPKTGELIMIRYNNDDRSTLNVDGEDVEPFYDALRKWNEVLTSQEGEYWSQLTPGTALIFDNYRVLHGRSAFVGNRRLCGAYVPHDDFRSRLAVLRNRFGDLGAASRSSSKGGERSVWDDSL